jgi:uncharacterized protein (TIGR02996 family)
VRPDDARPPGPLDAIRERPDDGPRWLALAGWLLDKGRDDEAVVIRTFWPVLRDSLAVATLDDVARNAGPLSAVAREVERRAREGPDDGWPTE